MRNEFLVQLQDMLADLYPSNEDALRVAKSAGLRAAQIRIDNRPLTTWHGVIAEATAQEHLKEVISIAHREYPNHAGLKLAISGQLDSVRGPEPAWVPHAEKIIDENDLLPVAFLSTGARLAQSTGRVLLDGGASGTGFLIEASLLLTNEHVLPTADIASGAVFEMGYEQDISGRDLPPTRVQLVPHQGFASSKEDDWAATRIAAPGNVDGVALATATVTVGDRVFIIQHPGGGPKQVALGSNLVTYVDDRRIQYLTDTMPGSSGSPVFDSRWRLVALHHSGGWLSEPGLKQRKFRNQGIPIACVREGLVAAGLISA
jgi:hypothetical protein